MANETSGSFQYNACGGDSCCTVVRVVQAPSPLERAGGEVKTRDSTGLELSGERIQPRADLYYLHSDHLGTATYVTDSHGSTTQFFLNLPYGETMAEQNIPGDYDNPYKFNGKELDGETGLYYYGARYYDPRVSVWLSVDPLASEFPEWSPYNYCLNNPIVLIDPDGQAPLNEYKVVMKGGQVVSTEMTGTKGGNQKDYITIVNMDRAPYADGVNTIETNVATFSTSGPGNYFEAQQRENPTPGYREIHNKNTELEAFQWLPVGRAGKVTTLLGAAKKYTISQVKDALKEVYKKLGTDGSLPKTTPGKWGSPQRSDGTKGYRLDPAHPNRPPGHPESVPHINWWDRTNGAKRGKGLVEDVVPVINP